MLSLRRALVVTAILGAAGCATDQEIGAAVRAVNQAFQSEYEIILKQKGNRVVSAPKRDAFDAIRIALARLGFQAESQDPGLGYLAVFALAPAPLNIAEWQQATAADSPRLRQIAREHVGMAAEFIGFEPEGLQVVITATVLDRSGDADVSLTMRMREIAPPRSGIPRREYPPPTAVRMGLDKIWAAFEQELSLRSSK